jgi:hypothetical protein
MEAANTARVDDDGEVTLSDDEVPFDVNDEVEVDFEDAPAENEPLPTLRKCPAVIAKARIRRNKKDNTKPEGSDNPWQKSQVSVMFQIDKELGTDGEGRFAGRTVWQDYVYAVNTEDPYYSTGNAKEKWSRSGDGWAPIKALFTAVTGSAKGRIGDAFLEAAVGTPVTIDIINSPKRVQSDGVWINSDEHRNEVKNLKARQVAVVEQED